jgi:peptide/nickel transport system ATP-binding protein
MKEELIQLKNVSYSVVDEQLSLVKGTTADILFDINFDVCEKEVLGICGESGGGKSTLAKLVAGIIKPTNGELILNDKLSAEINKPKAIQILFQNNSNLINPYRKVGDVIDEALNLSGTNNDSITERKAKLFETLNINRELTERRGYELSGGERQRVALARLLAVKPKVLILDEPFSAQDVTSQLNFVEVLKRLNEEFGVTMICISHDLKILRKFTHKVIVLQNGRIVEEGDCDQIFKSPNHPYTRFLLSAEEFSLTEEEIHSQSNFKTQ